MSAVDGVGQAACADWVWLVVDYDLCFAVFWCWLLLSFCGGVLLVFCLVGFLWVVGRGGFV
ncbi:hypothetical protein RA279_28910 [Pseudomonas syringae pv. tagetis]|uniref:hypothetical protein n=1 Tax=Pseudomonas syringae group genomosp. 7 TaxID=251699 RepID=UPI003770513A